MRITNKINDTRRNILLGAVYIVSSTTTRFYIECGTPCNSGRELFVLLDTDDSGDATAAGGSGNINQSIFRSKLFLLEGIHTW